jgi:tRNA(fMet)-specific endonuclease VapC
VNRLLLDTSAYAAFFRGHPDVKAVLQEAVELFLSPIVLGELRSGFLKGGRPVENEKQLSAFLATPRCAVCVVDDETSHRYAAIHDYLRRQGTPVSANGLWIAASAAQHGLTVVTLDGDFEKIPQVLARRFEAVTRGSTAPLTPAQGLTASASPSPDQRGRTSRASSRRRA